MLTAARHDAESLLGGGTRVRLSESEPGWLESVMGHLYRGLSDRYLLHEANGLGPDAIRGPSSMATTAQVRALGRDSGDRR